MQIAIIGGDVSQPKEMWHCAFKKTQCGMDHGAKEKNSSYEKPVGRLTEAGRKGRSRGKGRQWEEMERKEKRKSPRVGRNFSIQ